MPFSMGFGHEPFPAGIYMYKSCACNRREGATMRRVFLCCCTLALLVAGFAAPGGGLETAAAAPEQIATNAESAALIDVASGRVLYAKQENKRMRIASLTKIMTAIVAIERGKLADQVTVGSNAVGKEGSSVYLQLGEKISLHHLLYGLMLRSGNDAAVAIAEHVGGSLDGFVLMMNEKARELGMDGSHFMNPHGLDHDEHYSTAGDMARLTAYALKNPIFQEIVKTEIKRVPNPNEKWDRVWYNKNKMLAIYKGADGVKTGYTKLANRCLVSSATRGGQQLAVVTLNDPDDWADHSRLLDWGFKYYPLRTLVEKGQSVQAGYAAGRSFVYAMSEDEAGRIAKALIWHDPNSLPGKLGEAGRWTFKLDDKPIGSVPIYAADSQRLQEKERGAYQDAGAGARTGWSGWTEVMKVLVRELFQGEGSDRRW